MPQAASAHDTFWDFVSLMPESTHMLMWVMSDRAIPRSYRMMQGFGVHTFRFVNAAGESRFVKFHWNPLAGTHSLAWDEAVKISGADPDFHRRDLWEAIEAGAYPEWELGVQVFTEEEAERFSFDVLDATKIIPEELVPLDADRPHGAEPQSRQLLRRDRAGRVLHGAHRAGPRLQQRSAARRPHPFVRRYADLAARRARTSTRFRSMRRSRRCTTTSATACTARRSLAGASPTSRIRSAAAVRSRPACRASCPSRSRREEHKVRGKPEKFAEHYNQATLFWNSQSDVEKQHIIRAFRFELTKVQTAAVRERVVAQLRNVAEELAQAVADGLGMTELPDPLPKVLDARAEAGSADVSKALSLLARPGEEGIKTRRIAILVADGVDGAAALALHEALLAPRARCRASSASSSGRSTSASGDPLEVEISLETAPPWCGTR